MAAILNTVMKLWVPIRIGELLDLLSNYQF
jgi:hypothetical protein